MSLVLDFSELDLFSFEIVGDLGVWRSQPLSCNLSEPPQCRDTVEVLRRLRPPEFFATCADGVALTLWLCLSDAFEPEPACEPGPLTCPP